MLLAVLVGVSVDYGFGLLPALVCTVLGWFLLTLLTRLPFLRLERIDDFLWRFSTGRSLELDAQEAVALYIEEVRSQASNEGGS
jgi:hypothetical protein